tara:strand:- start:1089 stop:2267 length:1179 start_codon:yes stop_codon:yes gene_type:complete
MMLAYTMLAIVLLVLVARATIKLKYGFWGAQPVFHVYDLLYWVRPPGIIEDRLPMATKYVDRINIKTQEFPKMSSQDLKGFCQFIRSHYLRSRGAKYSPTDPQITTAFANNEYPSYLTTYHSSITSYDKTGGAVRNLEITGVISARPLTLTLGDERFPVYYVDNLCVHPDHRRKGVAPKLIQTHHYDTRYSTPQVKVHLFKREGEMTAIVPLVAYFTHMYVLPELRKARLPRASFLVKVESRTLRVAVEFMRDQCAGYAAVIAAGIPTLAASIANGTLEIYMLMESHVPLAVYALRDPAVTHGNDKALECCASARCCNDAMFTAGFLEAVRRANKTLRARSLLIECLGDNEALNGLVIASDRLRPLGRSPTAYFLYNYACRSVSPSSTFVLL